MIDCTPNKYFLFQVWKYEEGEVTHVGMGHAGIITQARFSPDGRYIVSVSSDGAMFRWKVPYTNEEKPENPKKKPLEVETVRSQPDDVIPPSTPNESIKSGSVKNSK